jgi:hypothetical protein
METPANPFFRAIASVTAMMSPVSNVSRRRVLVDLEARFGLARGNTTPLDGLQQDLITYERE